MFNSTSTDAPIIHSISVLVLQSMRSMLLYCFDGLYVTWIEVRDSLSFNTRYSVVRKQKPFPSSYINIVKPDVRLEGRQTFFNENYTRIIALSLRIHCDELGHDKLILSKPILIVSAKWNRMVTVRYYDFANKFNWKMFTHSILILLESICKFINRMHAIETWNAFIIIKVIIIFGYHQNKKFDWWWPLCNRLNFGFQ